MSDRKAHHPNPLGPLTRFWTEDRGLSLFLVLLLVTVFALPPFLPTGSGRSVLGDLLFGLLLVTGVYALFTWRFARWVLTPVAAVAISVLAANWIVPMTRPLIELGTLLSLLLLLIIVVVQTFRGGRITVHRIMGGVSAYLLLGMIWAAAYDLLEILRPGAFAGPVNAVDGARAWFYFSFTTLTTTGYGDVVPVHPIARSLATLESVAGSLFLTILLARLVSLATTTWDDEGSGPDDS